VRPASTFLHEPRISLVLLGECAATAETVRL
jgi:hypothetical protein